MQFTSTFREDNMTVALLILGIDKDNFYLKQADQVRLIAI